MYSLIRISILRRQVVVRPNPNTRAQTGHTPQRLHGQDLLMGDVAVQVCIWTFRISHFTFRRVYMSIYNLDVVLSVGVDVTG